MATSHQRRPDGKISDPKAIAKPDASLQAELDRLDAQRRALEERGDKSQLDPEVVARLAPSLGNAALAGLLNRGTDTASAAAGEAALEEKQKEEEEREEGEEQEAGEVEHVLPSFSTGGGGGGGGRPPWAMARELGGDDDGEADALPEEGPRWRPMPVLTDPDDEDAEIGDAEAEEDGDAEEGPDLAEAEAVLGAALWRAGPLSRGLRYARNLARPGFGPEQLVTLEESDSALRRARVMLRFAARHADGLDAAVLTRAAVAEGEGVFPACAGYAGATARALALVEVALASMPPRWASALDIVADPRPRARVEAVAGTVAERGGLAGVALVEAVAGQKVAPEDVEPVLVAHPAAFEALTTVARVAPLPLVDRWTPPERPAPPPPDSAAAIDAVLARFTGGEDAPPDGLTPADLGALFDAMNALLGAVGGTLVELGAAGVALAPHAPLPAIVGALGPPDAALRRAARRLFLAGQEVERLLGTREEARVVEISIEAMVVRATIETVRQGALATLATLLFDHDPSPPELPDLLVRAEVEARAGRTRAAAALLDAAIVASPPELEGRVLLFSAGLLARMGLPRDGVLPEAAARLGGGVLAVGAHSLAAGLALSRGDWAAAEHAAQAGAEIATRHGLVYGMADAACSLATARAAARRPWRDVLERAAVGLREREEGGALNLLKARWAELTELHGA